MSADKKQQQLDELTQPVEELTTDQAADVRGGFLPATSRPTVTATSSNSALDSLLTSEASVQKV